jgi:iron-sulfur cluster repair protein YtfE (RIC family)
MNAICDPATGRYWASARELTDHIGATYHGYLRLTLPLLDGLTEQIARQRLLPLTLMDRFEREFTALADLLETHIAKQESWLFPKMRELRERVGETAWACRTGDTIEELIGRLTRDDQDALTLLQQIEACLTDARWRDKGPLVDQLVHDIRELHENFEQHARLERDVLFPHVRGLLPTQALAV